MSPDPFDLQIELAHRRMEALRARAGESGEQAPLLLEAIEELSATLEELHVANEELRQQNDELAAGRQLIEAERSRYQALFEFAPDGYLVTDTQAVIREANRAAAEMLGVYQEFLVGKPLVTYIAETDRQIFHTYLIQLPLMPASKPRVLRWQLTLQPRSGASITAALTVGLVGDHDGRLVGLRWLLRDISDKVRMDRELRNSSADLRAVAAHLVSVREAERTQLAHELHDELGQCLAALKMDLWLLANRPQPASPIVEKVERMLTLVGGMIDSAKRIFTDLRPYILDELGLAAAIEWQTREFQKRTGIECRCTITPMGPKPDPRVSTALFRICEEAMTDAARYGHATSITVTLNTMRDGNLVLTVEDNGRDVPVRERADTRSLGLASMRERAIALEGTLVVTSNPSGGTSVTAVFPPQPPRHEAP